MMLVLEIQRDQFIRFYGGCRVVIAKYKNTVHLGTRVYPPSVFALLNAFSLCVRLYLLL